jgi:HSP20 family molecular chaperone IbpA
MENTNVDQPPRKSSGANIGLGLVLLALGIIIGVIVGRDVWHETPTVAVKSAQAIPGYTPLPESFATVQTNESNPFSQVAQMRADIDQVIERSLNQLRLNPKFAVFNEGPGYSLSMDVRDLKNRYQIRAFLPDTKTADAQVKLDGNLLKVDVSNKTSEKEVAKNTETMATEWGHYEEVVPLAGPLKEHDMKVQREAHELIITVPKA